MTKNVERCWILWINQLPSSNQMWALWMAGNPKSVDSPMLPGGKALHPSMLPLTFNKKGRNIRPAEVSGVGIDVPIFGELWNKSPQQLSGGDFLYPQYLGDVKLWDIETNPRIFAGWWFGTFFILPYIGFLIIPIDFHIFQRGGLTINQFVRRPQNKGGPVDFNHTWWIFHSMLVYPQLPGVRRGARCARLPWGIQQENLATHASIFFIYLL